MSPRHKFRLIRRFLLTLYDNKRHHLLRTNLNWECKTARLVLTSIDQTLNTYRSEIPNTSSNSILNNPGYYISNASDVPQFFKVILYQENLENRTVLTYRWYRHNFARRNRKWCHSPVAIFVSMNLKAVGIRKLTQPSLKKN